MSGQQRNFESNDFVRQMRIDGVVKHGLDQDARNEWFTLYYVANEMLPVDEIQMMRHYVERCKSIYDQDLAEKIISLSRPESIKAYDELVDRFNVALPEIKKTRDLATIRAFYEEAESIICSD